MSTLIRFALFALALVAGAAQAADPLVISSGRDSAVPIAVVPFGWQGGNVLPEDMSNIIGNDLRNSGYFEPIPRQNMISQPAQASEVIYRDWQALGAQYVLVGSIVPNGGRLQIQYALLNVATQQQVLTGSVGGTTDQLRDMSHYIADQSFEKLTGIKGAFSTRLLYVTAERFSVDNTRYTLQRSDYDGARPVTLLQSREPILSPRFSPDGRVSPMCPSSRSVRASSCSTSTPAAASRSPTSKASTAPRPSRRTATAWPSCCRATATRRST